MATIRTIPVGDYPLEYNPDTGEFTKNGKRTGYFRKCGAGIYRAVKINKGGPYYHAHRVAWEAMNGPIPDGMCIDHINRDRLDNRIANLRVATMAENNRNVRASKANTTGFRGVIFYGYNAKGEPRWRSGLCIDRKFKSLGLYASPEEASSVHEAARKRCFGEFYNEPSVT